MVFRRYFVFLFLYLFFMVSVCSTVLAKENVSEISQFDSLRADMSYLADKNTKEYARLKQNLNKIILQEKIDYTQNYRFNDSLRLIGEQKYNAAIYELNALIDENYNVSKCYELLGDICFYSKKSVQKTIGYYKKSLKNDSANVSVLYKMSKIYLAEHKNIMGLEYLAVLIDGTDDYSLLNKIENMILNMAKPNDKFEINNFYETLAKVQIKLGKREDSYKNFIKALQANPEDIYLKYYLVDLLYEDDCNPDIVKIVDSILFQKKNDTQIRTTKAKALAKSGKLNSAYKEYIGILKQNPESKQAKYGIYKLLEDKLPLNAILAKVNFNHYGYAATKEECLKFAEFLDEFDDIEGANKYRNLAAQMKEAEKRQIEYRMGQEIIKQQEAKVEIEKQKERELQKIKEEQEKTERQKIEQDKKAELEEQKKYELEQKKQEKLIKQQETKKRQEELKEERKKQEEIKKQKALQEEQEKIERQKKQKAQQNRLEYEQRKINLELKAFQTKNPQKYAEYNKMLDTYLKIEQKDSNTYLAIANTYKLMEAPTASIKFYKEAIKLNPAESDLYYGMALAYMELDSFETAYNNLNKAIGLNKENTKAKNLLPFVKHKLVTRYINDAYAKFEEKKYLEASSVLDEGIKKFSDNAQLYYYRALSYDAMNRNAAAIIDLQKAVNLDSSLYMAFYQLGKSYEKINDERNALVAYERFLSIEPDEKDLTDEIQKKVVSLGKKYY